MLIEFPQNGESTSVKPGQKERLELNGVDPDSLQIDILGADVIISDPETGANIILEGMALIMFEPEIAPILVFNGEEMPLQELFSKIGEVGNLTVKDFIAISSIKPQKENEAEQPESEAEEEENQGNSPEITEDVALKIIAALKEAQQPVEDPQETELSAIEENDYTSTAPQFAVDQRGEFSEEAVYSSNKKSSQRGQAPPEPPTQAEFSVNLLQPQSTNGYEDLGSGPEFVFRGGGGSQASFFDPRNEAQFSTEVIDLSERTTDSIIYADNPDRFTPTRMSRAMEFDTNLPDGFIVTQISLSGLPAGITITESGGGASSFTVNNPALNANGSITLHMEYDVPQTLDFVLNFSTLSIVLSK